MSTPEPDEVTPEPPPQPKTSMLAVVSFVLGLCGFLLITIPVKPRRRRHRADPYG
jgi:hypothetical protein